MTKYLLSILLGILTLGSVIGQDEGSPLVIDLDKINSDSRREEIQRYFGYEDLLGRYLTIPYDTSVNTNQKGRYIDVGYGIIAILPLVILGLLYRRKRLFYSFAALFVVYLSLCFSYSHITSVTRGQALRWDSEWGDYLVNDPKPFVESILAFTYHVTGFIAQPLVALSDKFSGDTDHITYPILSVILLLSLWVVGRSNLLSPIFKFIGILYISFGFLWVVLSGGIIWYGFLLFPLSYGFAVHFLSDKKFDISDSIRIVKGLSLGALVIWALMGYIGRVSNITYVTNNADDSLGKGIVDVNVFGYTTGMISSQEARESAYRNIGNVLDEINSNDALIYQLGTSMAFEIKDNPNRLYLDATLTQFFPLLQSIKDKETVMEIYKAGGIRYMIIDLYTHTLDQTPDKSLTQKFTLLLNTIYQNPKVRLRATDRIVEVTAADGSKRNEANVFGEKIMFFGSYAIYEII